MSLNRIFFLLLVVACLSNCGVKLRTVYDHEIDFSRYKTFCWMDGCESTFKNYHGPSYLNDSLLQSNIRKAIIEELKNKGLTQDNSNPDLLVGFTVTLKDEKIVEYGQPPQTSPTYGPADRPGKVITYLEGTLILGMADRRESKMVWESFAVSYLDLKPDFSQEKVLKGIKLVLKDFPPKK